MVKKIYWHIITYIDEDLAKKYAPDTKYYKGQYIGMDSKETTWQIFDDDARDIVLIAKYKCVGSTYNTGNSKEDFKEFKELKKRLEDKK